MNKKVLWLISVIMVVIFLSSCQIGNIVNKAVKSENIDLKFKSDLILGNIEIVKENLEDGANINKVNVALESEQNPIILAVTNNRDKLAKYLIENGADANYTDSSGRSLLMFLTRNDNTSFCELLIKHGAKIDKEEKNGYTALEYLLDHSRSKTTEKNMDSILTILLNNGAKIRPITLKAALKGEANGYVTSYSLVKRILEGVIKSGNKSEINPILEAAILGESLKEDELIKANKMKKDEEQRILFYTAAFGKVETLKLLENKGISVNSLDKLKNTTLIIASQYGNIEVVKYLLSKNVNIEARNKESESALFTAVKYNQYDIVKYLIKQGADIKPFAIFASTIDILSEASGNGNVDMIKLIVGSGYPLDEKNTSNAMFSASKNNKVEVLKYFLDNGVNPDIKNSDYMPLESACQFGNLDSVKFLVEHGAKVDGIAADGEPMSVTITYGTNEILEYLIKKGANVNNVEILAKAIGNGDLDKIKILVENGANIEYQTKASKKASVIIKATYSRHILEYLIQKGANINYQNDKGETALISAVYSKNLSSVKLLKKNKADLSLKDKQGRTALDLAKMGKDKDIIKLLENKK